jgi:integrase/recombinase XerD
MDDALTTRPVGQLLYSFLVDYLGAIKGLRPSSVRSYRDVIRLFLLFVAQDARRKISRLSLADMSFDRVQMFLRHLEVQRRNHTRTRNHRLAVLHTFFDYLAMRIPEMAGVSERVTAIPVKRAPPPEMHFMDRDEVHAVLAKLPAAGRLAARDRALLLFLYNTGARAQEVADLRVENLDLTSSPRVRLLGKGAKWRVCPLWADTVHQLRALLEESGGSSGPGSPVFASARRQPLTRFGIYKIVRRHAQWLDAQPGPRAKHVTPHTFRHTAAVHLLESGVEINVIRAWLGHVNLATTNRYAEITTPMKEAALRACEPPPSTVGPPRKPAWHDDRALLQWLESL